MTTVEPSALRRLLLLLSALFARWFSSAQASPTPRSGSHGALRQSKGAAGMLGARAAAYFPRPDWPHHVLARLAHRAPRSHQRRLRHAT